jgi:tetratricopeptide (TPR) repeat protein
LPEISLKSFALHSKIHLQTREFHIHTGSVPEKQMVISEIFEKGQFISSQHQPFYYRDADDKTSEINYLRFLASNLHKSIIDEVKMLFLIHERIASLNKYLAHFKLGSLFYHRNILDEAILNYQRSIELNGDFVSAYVQLGKCYIKLEEYDKAVEAFRKGLEKKADFPDMLNGLGVALTFAGKYEKATQILQHTLSIKPDFDEANFNLGVVLFLSTLQGEESQEKAVVPSRVIRYIKVLNNLDRYQDKAWKEAFELTLQQISDGNLTEILNSLREIQFKLITHLKIDTLIESFYLKFMYSGRELAYEELESYEKRILSLARQRENFADYWNEMGIIHIIQCRHLFLKSVAEFEQAVALNQNYKEAANNLELIKNIKKGFMILLRAILK